MFAINLAFGYRYVCLANNRLRDDYMSRSTQIALNLILIALSTAVLTASYFGLGERWVCSFLIFFCDKFEFF